MASQLKLVATFFQPIGSPTVSKYPQLMLAPLNMLMMTKTVNRKSNPPTKEAAALVLMPMIR